VRRPFTYRRERVRETLESSTARPFGWQACVVVMMFSQILGCFSVAGRAERDAGRRHLVDISGNVLSLFLPGGMSREFPIEEVAEAIDVDALLREEPPSSRLIARCWWPILEPGYFRKEQGIIMMQVSVHPVLENRRRLLHTRPYDVTSRLDFMLSLDEAYSQAFAETERSGDSSISEVASFLGDHLGSQYRDEVFHAQKWTAYSIGGPATGLIVSYALPVDRRAYLQVRFHYAPNDDVAVIPFDRAAMAQKIDRIVSSLEMHYAADNPFRQIVGEAWLAESTNDVVQQHEALIKRKLYSHLPAWIP